MNKQLQKIIESLLSGGFDKNQIREKLVSEYKAEEVENILDLYPDKDEKKKYRGFNIATVVLLTFVVIMNILQLIIGGSGIVIILIAIIFFSAVIRGLFKMNFYYYPIIILVSFFSLVDLFMNTPFNELQTFDIYFYAIKIIVIILVLIFSIKIWLGLFSRARAMLGIK